MRHVVIQREGLETTQSVETKIRTAPTPFDKNILAYYKFDKEWQNHDSFYYISVDFKGVNVAISSSSEQE